MEFHNKLLMVIIFTILELSQTLSDHICSRPVSRRVGHAITRLLKAEGGISKHFLPGCFLNQKLHLFNHEESINIVFPTGERQCGFCGEIFEGEKSYDQHMESVHPTPHDGEFFCSEKLCSIFGQCGEASKLQVCTAASQGDLSEFCRKRVWGCFSGDGEESSLIRERLSRKLCNKERMLEVNGCIEGGQRNNTSLAEIFSHHFPKVLLLFIMCSTFVVSYKINEYINKVK
ncbi:putative signal peptide-containing protein [Cryptosporidium canis]|uniref:Signal peptide-containing protein n=1 Tax=Cryptosporidium canis TaxID=195482 RepID=A0A9D5DJ24_9CRYT|nr:putative signal peptide-containing protein [Cryptosporidium canis]